MVFAIVVGAVAFVGTTAVLGAREARRTGPRPGGRGPEGPTVPEVPPESPQGAVVDTPRERAASSSIRLIDPPETGPRVGSGAPDDSPTDTAGDRDDGLGDQSSPIPFRGRLGGGSDGAPVRHLRPVPGGRPAPPGVPGGGRTAGGQPVEQTGAATASPEDEE